MKEAVVIGVGKYAQLRDLDSDAGAKGFADWLTTEGFGISMITDAEENVTASRIRKTIKKILDKGTTTHLVVYFTGHGYLNGTNEIWLLSDAPEDPSAAINLTGNIEFARLSKVPNIVFISDACRSSPDSLQASAVQGSLVFPSPVAGSRAGHVDRWFATQPGTAAFELPLEQSIDTFSSAYTRVFVDAHSKAPDDIVQEQMVDSEAVSFIPSHKLRDYLHIAVPELLLEKEIYKTQVPSAIIESDPDFFLCPYRRPRSVNGQDGGDPTHRSVPSARPTRSTDVRDSINESLRHSVDRSIANQPTLTTVTGLDETNLGSITASMNATIASIPMAASKGMDSLLGSLYTVAEKALAPKTPREESVPTFTRSTDYAAKYSHLLQSAFSLNGRNSFETECGFSVFGAQVEFVIGLENDIEKPNDARVDIRLYPTASSHSILMKFADGSGAILPSLRGYIGTILVGQYGISNITYQRVNQPPSESLIRLRASVAAASNMGVFTVDSNNAERLARRIRQGKSADPTLGIYACYAYQHVGMTDKVRSVKDYLSEFRLFDIEMLARNPFDDVLDTASEWTSVSPICPLLSQGWDLIEAKQLRVPKLLGRAASHRKNSLWTTFEPEGINILVEGIKNGELIL